MKKTLIIIIVLLLGLVTVGCRGEEATEPTPTAVSPTPTLASSEPERGLATVESIRVNILESFPVQVNVVARGMLADGCTNIDTITQNHSGDEFQVAMTTFRDPQATCTQAVVPFEEVIGLDVLGLEAGTYTVTVNGQTGSFTLDQDNVSPQEPAATATPEEPAASEGATINGRVWHDLCAVSGEGEAASASDGCVEDEEGGFVANGTLDTNEPGIENVVVSLGEGQCPADDPATTTTTDADGSYRFTDLEAGTYCVSVDPVAEENSAILLPGGFTAPERDTNQQSVTVNARETAEDVNFGWDYQFLPIPEASAGCTNSIAFIEDLNIPDDTAFPPGAEFTKSWRLRNNGTCPWTTDYALVYVGGDDIPGPETVPLERPVAPGQPVDLSVTFTAPDEPGTYRENWQVANAAGNPFGINGFIEDAFWLQIVVEEGAAAATPASGTGDIGGVIWSDVCTLADDGTPSAGCVETSEDGGVFRADGTLNFSESVLEGITVSLSEGACPQDFVVEGEDVVATAVTDEDGLYRFTDLESGTYCVSVDAFSEDNVDLLIPGDWTYPAYGTPLAGVVLDPGEEILTIDFGWEFQ